MIYPEGIAQMKHITLVSTCLILLVSLLSCSHVRNDTPTDLKTMTPGDHSFVIKVEDSERSYLVHVPPIYDPAKEWPVVVMFHGGGGTAEHAMQQTHWNTKADQEGFLVAFPEGTRPDPSQPAKFYGNPQSWNDGSERQSVGAVERNAADVKFVFMMLSDIKSRLNVDESRIYATGFSNGASMTFRVARELSEVFAAAAPVAGGDWLVNENPERPISILYMTGTADPLNPLEGGEIHFPSISFGVKTSVEEMINNWVKIDGCSEDGRVVYDKDGANGIIYSHVSTPAEVVFYTIEGHGHYWPGGDSDLPESIAGKNTAKVNATDIIWDFFANHPKN
jgi:polyhydroxybutyrate depolymerase